MEDSGESFLGKMTRLFTSYVPLSQYTSKVLARYLFDRYMGQYLINELDINQLELDVTSCRGVVKNLVLDSHALNEAAESLNIPFIITEAYIAEVCILLPFNLQTEHFFIEIYGLKVTLHPKQRDGEISVVNSMIGSMSTSMQVAQECLNKAMQQADCSNANHCNSQKPTNAESVPGNENINTRSKNIEGAELVANLIETLFNRIRIRFKNSCIKLEYIPKSSYSGIALELFIDNIDYFDEASLEKDRDTASNIDHNNEKNTIDFESVSNKKFLIEGITIFTDEFAVKTPSNSFDSQSMKNNDIEHSDEEFHDVLNNPVNYNDNSTSTCNTIYESTVSDISDSDVLQNSVLVAKLYNRLEIKIQLRKSDIMIGPKVKIEMNCGCLITFLSPRQVHLLLELLEAIKSPETDNFNFQQPMNKSDYKTCHQELIKHVSPPNRENGHALNNQEGWSSPPDMVWDDNMFLPFNMQTEGKEKNSSLVNSTLSDISDLEASFTSTSSSRAYNNINKKDNMLTSFKIRLNSLCLIILHDDLIIPSLDESEVITRSSVKEMERKSESFFSHMNYVSHSETSFGEFEYLKSKADTTCLTSHLRVIGTAIGLEGNEKMNSDKWHLNTNIAAGWLEVKECLKESDQDSGKIYCDLLIFEKKEISTVTNPFQLTTKPKVQISINYYETIPNSIRSRKVPAKIDVTVVLDDCLTEIDISLLDRINLLLNKQNVIIRKEDYIPVDKLPSSHLDNQAFFKEIMEDNLKPETVINIGLEVSHITIKVFFPIPDLRPLSDMNRVPWWKRNVRREVMWINAQDLKLKSTICSTYPTNIEILSNEFLFLFQESNDTPQIPLVRATSSAKEVEKEFSSNRINIKIFPTKIANNLNDEAMPEQEDLTKSTLGFCTQINDGEPKLFNKRTVASSNQGLINELSIPADGEEMNKFINETLDNVQIDVYISFNDVQLILPSKHILEIIYNRLVSDLLLWTPSAPKCARTRSSFPTLDDFSIGTTLIPDSYYNPSSEFKPFSSVKNESDFDSEFTSVYEQVYSFPKKQTIKIPVGQTFLGLQVSMRNCTGSIHTPYKDENEKIITGKYGDLSFIFEKGFIFIASGYKGDINALQGCVVLNSVKLYHKANNIISYLPVQLNSEFSEKIKCLDMILYPSDSPCRIGGGSASFHPMKDCVSLCFKSNFDILKNENLFEVTGNLYCLTLRHYMTNANESWISQIQDMFDVEDYPVEGYSLPESVTEFNIHFEFCGIDYRPLYLPLKSYLAFDSLAISSNLAVKGNSTVIMFIVEDAALFLSADLKSNKVNLKKNYVCVIDIGVLELCMKMDCSLGNNPVEELLFSNNVIHVRTCADSCKAFMELLIYFSEVKDLSQDPVRKCSTEKTKVILEPSCSEQIIQSQNSQIPAMNELKNQIAEAVKDYKAVNATHVVKEVEKNVDLFLFPGEDNEKKNNCNASMKNSFQVDLETALKEALNEDYISGASHANTSGRSSDEDFCVLDDIPGTGIKSPTGKPKAKHIRHEHVPIIDSFFDPSANEFGSRFASPKHFPQSNCKYTLQEMSIVWHIYGGEDFTPSTDCDDKNGNKCKNVRISAKSPHTSPEIKNKTINRGASVSFTKGDTSRMIDHISSVSLHGSPTLLRPNVNAKWFSIGGPNRNHDILMEIHLSKIRFKYEMYSEKCPLVSRQVFTINDIEIKDRLTSSKINKFLYQYSCEALPKQASSNMLQIRGITRKSDPVPTYEGNLMISCRPIRLNIDQDAFLFLCKFIGCFINDREEEKAPILNPIMTLNCNDELSSANQMIYLNNSTSLAHEDICNAPIYYRNVIFSPDVPIRIDYHGKHIDINSQYGPMAGLLIGLGQLNNSVVTLKRTELKSGTLGLYKVATSLLNEWINDIKQNQLPSILGGVGPMHSFVTLFGGVKDLFWLPFEQYNKDGRVFRGIQRGTSSFTSSSAYAILDLTARFVGTIQSTAETMYDMVSSGPSVKNKSYKSRKGRPKDIREGVTTAFGLVRYGLGDTASALIKVATEEHSHKGMSGALGGVLRQIPPSVVQPIIIASEATCTVIGGMTNQLVPDAGKEAADKWKS